MAKRQGVSNSFLCRKLGLRVSYLTEVKNGKASITDERAAQFAELLGVSLDELLYDFENDPDDILSEIPDAQREVLLEENGYDTYAAWKAWKQLEEDCIEETEQKEKSPSVSDEEIKFALFGGGEITDEMWAEVKRYAEFVKQKYGK